MTTPTTKTAAAYPPAFIITSRATGMELFHGEARDEQNALDLLAVDAGYTDYADLLDRVEGSSRDDVLVERAPLRPGA